MRLSVRTGSRPFFVAGAALTLSVLIAPGWRLRVERALDRLTRTPRSAFVAIAVVLAAGVLVIGLRHGSFVATASDSYGYVSQADLWQRGVPRIEQALVPSAPWPDAQYTFSPLGYRPSVDGRAIVPTYPPGYPLLMAAALSLFGQGSQYLVVPVLSAVTVFAVFMLGRQVAGNWVGLTAAVWLSASPAFLFHTVVPMSDVPATAAWTLVLLLILRPTRARAIGAGLCCGAAILIRPNLAPLAALVVLMDPIGRVFTRGRDDWRSGMRESIARAFAFICSTIPAVIALAWLNRYWYGAPFTTGYGDLRVLFSLHNLPTNLRHYAYWFWETQTIAIFLAPLALWTTGVPEERAGRVRLLLFACGVALCYAFYLPFDSWNYLRFLLPAYPALLILTAAVLVDMLPRFPKPIGAVVIVTLVGTVALSSERESVAKGAFDGWRSLRRFVDVSTYARTYLPQNAIYLTRLYSGSLRYYGGRPTLRWDVLDPAWLDRAVDYLRGQGFVPMIVIEEGDEDQDFRERFHGSRFGALDWLPAGEYHNLEVVHFFNPNDRH